MSGICVIGDVNVDIVSLLREPLQVNSDTQTTNTLNLGGSPCNMSMWLAHVKADVTFIAAIGDDLMGQWIRENLTRGGLSTENIQQVAGASTGTCIILVDQAGHRTMLPDPGANLHLQLTSQQQSLVKDSSVVVMSAYSFLRDETKKLATDVVDMVSHSATRLVLDAASSAPIAEVGVQVVQDYLSNADLILANEDEYALLADSKWLEQVPDLIVKLGANGAKWLRYGSVAAEVPAAEVKPIDTTGAGDSFLAGLVSVLTEHEDWFAISDEDRSAVLTRATEVAAMNIVTIGAGPI